MKLLIATAAAAALGISGYAIAAQAASPAGQPSLEQCSNHLFAIHHKALCATYTPSGAPEGIRADTSGPGHNGSFGPGAGQYN